jgi:hypothetical protein
MSKETQWMQVLSALTQLGGIATLSQLNRGVLSRGGAGMDWKTKTPEATIRRIVRQKPDYFHVLKRGLYCLSELAAQFDTSTAYRKRGTFRPTSKNAITRIIRGSWLKSAGPKNTKPMCRPKTKTEHSGTKRWKKSATLRGCRNLVM